MVCSCPSLSNLSLAVSKTTRYQTPRSRSGFSKCRQELKAQCSALFIHARRAPILFRYASPLGKLRVVRRRAIYGVFLAIARVVLPVVLPIDIEISGTSAAWLVDAPRSFGKPKGRKRAMICGKAPELIGNITLYIRRCCESSQGTFLDRVIRFVHARRATPSGATRLKFNSSIRRCAP